MKKSVFLLLLFFFSTRIWAQHDSLYIKFKNITAAISDLGCSAATFDYGSGLYAHGKQIIIQSLQSGNRFPHDDPKDSVYLYWLGEWYEGVCWRCMLDTLKMYVEQHPFAINYPGEVLDAIAGTWSATTNMPFHKKSDCIDEYNWLVKMQPRNMEGPYQYEIIQTMAVCLSSIDLNEEANMWYNWSLMFPDSSTVASAWFQIQNIRMYQKEIPQDTTPFHILTFPLKPLPGGTASTSKQEVTTVTLSISPNPITERSKLHYEILNPGMLRISLYDVLGKEIESLYSGLKQNGSFELPLKMQRLSSGTYFIRMQYGNTVLTRKIIKSGN